MTIEKIKVEEEEEEVDESITNYIGTHFVVSLARGYGREEKGVDIGNSYMITNIFNGTN